MPPVIRISDGVFRKLQRLSEPLVDTPNSVIERLLDERLSAEATSTLETTTDVSAVAPSPNIDKSNQYETRGVFLAPATAENIELTVANSVALSSLESRLDRNTLTTLRNALGGKSAFHCWATTTASRSIFDAMKAGDLVLFTPRATGRFTYRATVTKKIESQALGDALWPIIPDNHWCLVFLLEDVRPISLVKGRLVAEFGYDPKFPVYGITRVGPERQASAVARRGSLENVLSAVAVEPN